MASDSFSEKSSMLGTANWFDSILISKILISKISELLVMLAQLEFDVCVAIDEVCNVLDPFLKKVCLV